MFFEEIETPAVLIDLAIAERNIAAYQSYCDKHQLDLRPHIKTHKLPDLAQRQITAGAVGITCQKISEAEVMVAAGLQDILISYNILGASKLARLRDLSEKCSLRVTADNETVVRGLSWAFKTATSPLAVLVECDTGAGRCGAQTPGAAVNLAKLIDSLPGLCFAGLMTYPAVGKPTAVQEWLAEAMSLCQEADLACPVVSGGGTPDMWSAHSIPALTEYRVGTYIYNDRSLIERGVCKASDCALTVLTTVVSVPTNNRIIIDAGSKVLTSDLLGLQGYGLVVGHPEIAVVGLSEEHGELDCSRTTTEFQPGDRLQIIPNHACVVSNMVNEVKMIRNHKLESCQVVAARGCVF
ncbi:D-TA family PLP-dependent enzyme [Kiloniella laminariae]|uniref:D-TA family PLP-dependent enzyme n=1 Tax=Kiloniella laminariae TaxID=454162 RepID=UPI0003737304|nr:D-TA family PLP-dependent enzyme [Kiloniella laminariae]